MFLPFNNNYLYKNLVIQLASKGCYTVTRFLATPLLWIIFRHLELVKVITISLVDCKMGKEFAPSVAIPSLVRLQYVI